MPSRNRDQLLLVLGVGAVIGYVGYTQWRSRARADFDARPVDNAPARAQRRRRFGRHAVVGRTVTIARPRQEIWDFWRNVDNIPRFMENVQSVREENGRLIWTVPGPRDRAIEFPTEIVDERPGEHIAWRSTEDAPVDMQGKVRFRDAPPGRGTEVESIIAYRPRGGELGRWIASFFQKEPAIIARRELKRLKMLMETGEIATSQMNRTP
jgi:uncharacterized membrane protein